MAQPGGGDLHQHLVGAGAGEVHRLDGDRPGLRVGTRLFHLAQYGGADLHEDFCLARVNPGESTGLDLFPSLPLFAPALLASSTWFNACGVYRPPARAGRGRVGARHGGTAPTPNINDKAYDVVPFALGLIETGYRFGGNPEAGLDCSGMVSYVFRKSADMQLAGSAADLARQGKPVATAQLRPGDLVFFNTRNKSYSHVGIYIGDDRFVHAPNSRGKVRTESLKQGWFAARFEEGRSYFD